MRREIRIAGFGGQGVVLAGYVLGKAVALYDGREAVIYVDGQWSILIAFDAADCSVALTLP